MPQKTSRFADSNPDQSGHAFDPASTLPVAHLATVRSTSRFVAENAKTARAFLKAVDMGRPMVEIHIDELRANTPATDLVRFLEPIREGIDVGLMSEAGAPPLRTRSSIGRSGPSRKCAWSC